MKAWTLVACLSVTALAAMSEPVRAAVVFVTGADRGLGLEFVKEYAARGDSVIATCRHPDAAAELQALAKQNSKITIEKLDVGSDSDIQALAAKYQGKPIDILINNAGVIGKREDQVPGHFNRAAFHEVMDTNTFGALAVSDALRANITASTQKKIIVVTSGLGNIPTVLKYKVPSYYYSISKAAVNMAMVTLGAELKPQGVIVGLVSPGSVDTDMLTSAMHDYGLDVKPLTREESISKLIVVIDHLDQDKAGQGVNTWDGRIVPW